MIWLALGLIWLFGSAVLLVIYRRGLLAWWREPVLHRPVLIFESDDWGPGDASHVRALQALSEILAAYRDAEGRHPVMTLGVVLALADTARIRAAGATTYFYTALNQHPKLRDAMLAGVERGVFALQLHGMEHYWAPSLLASAQHDPAVRDWVTTEGLPRTETLLPPMQSRWIDAQKLPSRPLSKTEIEAAVIEEVAAFELTFNAKPVVVVPPTFVWTSLVERAWARQGVRYVVTPGRRYNARDNAGAPVADIEAIVNGGRSEEGVMYVVRDDYFEPALGHAASQGLQGLGRKTKLGRPTLLEMHRFNFVDDAGVAELAYNELRRLLDTVLSAYPTVAFISTEQLARILETHSPWIENNRWRRMRVWCARVRSDYAAWRWMRFTVVGWLIWLVALTHMRATKTTGRTA